jgi:competence protein ComEC
MFSISFNEYNVNDDKILSASPFIFVTPAAILGILTAKFFLNFYFAIISVGILLFTLGFLQVTRQKFNNIRSGALVKIDHFKNILILLALCFSFSIRYHQVASIRPQNYITHYHINGICSVTGTIREAHYYENNNHRYIIDLEKIGFDNKEADKNVKGKILLNTHSIKREFHYGDYIHCYGSLEKPQGQRNPGQFDYSAYLANRDIFYSITIMNPDSIVLLAEQRGNFFFQKIIAPVRKYARQVFFKYLARPGRALLNALILGERHDIEKEVMHDFQRIGVVHVLAISGLHVGFIIIFVLVLFSFLRISYPLKIMLLFLVLSGFIALVNFKAPVIRAVLMVVLFITGNLLERRMNPVQIILASAFIPI